MKLKPKLKRPSLSAVLYNSFYGILGAALLVLILITPSDLVIQTQNSRNGPTPNKWANRLVIPGAYGLTLAIGVCIFTLRIVSNRQTIKAIPKTWIPIEKDDVKKKVRKMIVQSLNRSAVLAWESRPRVHEQSSIVVSNPANRTDVETVEQAADGRNKKEKHGLFRRSRSQLEPDDHTVTVPPPSPVWGEISHNGWSSPTSPDLPDLQYTTVVLELPHLIEAKAVSLAPPDPESPSDPPLPDIRALSLLQRSASMGLREYIGQLIEYGVVRSPTTATSFLIEYEYARFSGRALSEIRFRDLMRHFAELLRNMNSLSPAILASLDIDGSESDIDKNPSSLTTPATPRSRSLASSRSVNSHSSEGTVRTGPTRSIGTTNGTPSKRLEFSTAPATPRSKKQVISRSPSINSFAQSRRPYQGSDSSSSSSLRSTSQGSVIRLSNMHEDGYTLTVPRAR
ncbi:hypothetical protein BKA65DRAFT_503312 [Rhexocercosporidium sp. MPI-PUGE-AT-0058]|nr:hypothetical protein BKA65DRAFT_503312 [Rhexocercosporidium sp. MPI-PUGE-AT-0058]